MSGHTLRDIIRYIDIKKVLGVAIIKGITKPFRKIESWRSRDYKRAKTWSTGVKMDTNDLDLQIEKIVKNQNEWKRRIHVDDHWN